MRYDDMSKQEALKEKKQLKTIHYNQHYQLEVVIEYSGQVYFIII